MPFSITSKPLVFGILAVSFVNIALFATTRATVDLSDMPEIALQLVGFALLWFAAHRFRDDPGYLLRSTRNLFEGLFFLTMFAITMATLNNLSMMIPFPFQDDLLAGWDAALGLNWLAYFEAVHSSPTAIWILEWAYNDLALAGLAVFAALAFFRDERRLRYYMEIFFYTALITMIVGACFPALAAVDRYIVNLSDYPNFPTPPGIYHLSHFETLRGASEIVINPVGLPGLVTFPSYHTASGIMLCIGVFRTWLFWPVLLYSAAMIASSPVFGGHYFIDLVAGASLAFLVAWVNARRSIYDGLFARRATRTETADHAADANLHTA
ncbi:phosphatase PAP2 family protein [Marivita sp. S2033]|uniref:phosphatase PAP2 family protein n=1 Tax=Marivita sp. S2033 TaxID=3373187 RepID=UPI003981CDE6